tara:strand:+ start:1023 stop:1259 length:237 start_codon:yes stop_codon:yes gene_type:complete
VTNKKFDLYRELTGYDATQMPKWTESYRGSFAMTKDLQKKLAFIKQELKLPAYMVVAPFVNNLYEKILEKQNEQTRKD